MTLRNPSLAAALLVCLGGVTANGGTSSDANALRCRLTEQRLVIDGVLDESCWRRAEVATDFKLLDGQGRAREQTECMVAYDADNLYIAFLCRESEVGEIRATHTQDDGPVWRDDCVEVFLDPAHDHRSYFHVIANFAGARFDEIGPRYPNPSSWDAPWRVATRRFATGWTAEIAIPFRSMNRDMPMAGTVWGFNANRQEYRLLERSGWSETLHSFHEPAHFGHLLFVPPS